MKRLKPKPMDKATFELFALVIGLEFVNKITGASFVKTAKYFWGDCVVTRVLLYSSEAKGIRVYKEGRYSYFELELDNKDGTKFTSTRKCPNYDVLHKLVVAHMVKGGSNDTEGT